MPTRSLKSLFPCKNCLIAISHKYHGKSFKLNRAENKVSVFDGTELIATEPVEKMSEAAGITKGFYLHQIERIRCMDG